MPHGESWFTIAFRGGYLWENLENLVRMLGGDQTWIAHEHLSVAHLFAAILVFLFLGVLAFVARTGVASTESAVVPEATLTVRTFVELFVGGVHGMMSDIMGPKAARYFLPLIGTCAFFIFFSNALALVPGFDPPTNNFNITLGLASIIFVTTHVYGLRENGFGHVKHLFGPIIAWYALPLMLLMFVIEVISHLARPLSLGIRLAANMAADHAVAFAFLGIFPFLLPVPVMLLGTLVVVVQTLVFCILSSVYIGLAIQHQDHH